MPLLFVGTPVACAWPCLTVNMVVFDTKDDKTRMLQCNKLVVLRVIVTPYIFHV